MTASRNVAVYIVGRGEITNTLGGSAAFIAQNTPEGCAVIDCAPGIAEHLFRVDEDADPPAIVARDTLTAFLPDEIEMGGVLALDVPAGAAVKVDGHLVGEADEDGLEIEFASPGRYLVEVDLWPFVPLRKRVVVD